MAADDTREGQDIARRIRDELERIREAERRVEEALESVRQARLRVEVIARDLTREEARVRALVRPTSDPSSGVTRSPPDALPIAVPSLRVEPAAVVSPVDGDMPQLSPAAKARWGSQDHRARLIAITALVIFAIAGIGWFAVRGFQKDAENITVAAADATQEPVTPAPEPVVTPTEAPDVLTSAPADPAALVVLYDSLFAARSPVFDTLLTTVDQQSGERSVKRAVAAWRGGSVDAQEADLIHSAFVQRVLKLDTDPRIEIDGQLLRNPCRGRSCAALLTFWKAKGIQYGLPQVPSDASTNVTGLRQAEVALVFGWLKEVHDTAATP